MPRLAFFVALLAVLAPSSTRADDPLHARIDRLILAGVKPGMVSSSADDAEFLRRIHLDLTGTIPTPSAARAFLDSKAADKRVKLIDALLAGTDYPRRMQE